MMDKREKAESLADRRHLLMGPAPQPLHTPPDSTASGSATYPPASLRDEIQSPHGFRPSPLPEYRRPTRTRASPERMRSNSAPLSRSRQRNAWVNPRGLPPGGSSYTP